MAVYINQVAGEPDYASLPAAKLLCFPCGEEGAYRPYVQAQFALGGRALHARLLCFEAAPAPGSRVEFLLQASVEGGRALRAGGSAGEGQERCTLSPGGEHWPAARFRRIASEDLQGVYWGMEIQLPLAALAGLLGAQPAPGARLWGNVYKYDLQSGEGEAHFLSLFPAGRGDVENPAHFGPLEIVSY